MNQSKSIYQNLETVEEIKELALNYLDKYQPSKKSLQVYLFRKAMDAQSNSVPTSHEMGSEPWANSERTPKCGLDAF